MGQQAFKIGGPTSPNKPLGPWHLAQLADAGARLRYHGDFDWPGLVIGNFVMREFRAEPWRFGTADYLVATAEHAIALRGDKSVVARWDDRLAGAMAARGVAVHEEGVAETLMIDLAAGTNSDRVPD